MFSITTSGIANVQQQQQYVGDKGGGGGGGKCYNISRWAEIPAYSICSIWLAIAIQWTAQPVMKVD